MKAVLTLCMFCVLVSAGFAQTLAQKIQGIVWRSEMFGESTYLRFDADGILRLSFGRPDDLTPMFLYSIDGTTMTVNGNVEFLCPTTVKGTYTVTFENNALRFTLIADECPYRPTIFVMPDFKEHILSSVAEAAEENVLLVPNPASSILRIAAASPAQSQPLTGDIRIVNTLGATVLSVPATEQIDVSILPAGAYTVRGSLGGVPFVKQLMITR
ncbi:MAG: T9SS type A sorting domain-containing protein [Candidatus Kapabacteria bacterium]|nr:T9SS type A sorting domain-containing protein [Candidatus Kapabacteria bacterium]